MDMLTFMNLLILLLLRPAAARNESMKPSFSLVHVGVVLDLNTTLGKIGKASILMAMDDFYDIHDDYTTKLALHFKDSQVDVVKAAAAAIDLLENYQVQAIIGPQKSEQAMFISELGNKMQVPIISFTATSPSLTSISNPYFIRTTLNDSAQVATIAAIMQAFGWRQAVPILEDTDYGRDILPYLIDALQEIDSHIPYHSVIALQATNDQIKEELYKLIKMQTRVFIIHMTAPMASRVLLLAKDVGMMDEGFVWIMTDGLTNIAESLSSFIIDSLYGAIGVKMYVPKSKKIETFTARWKKRFQQKNLDDTPAEMNNFALWAYDTVWALAIAVEKAGVGKPDFMKPNRDKKLSILQSLEVSKNGPKLLKEILESRFVGVSGKFELINGQLQSSTFQIINMVGRGERSLGFWEPKIGLSKLKQNNSDTYSTLMTDLNHVIWPGESESTPKGWDIPIGQKKLKIIVPKCIFPEFVNVEREAITNITTATGFSIEVFEAAVKNLPYDLQFDYVAFENADGQSAGTYNELVQQVYHHKYDAAVGDITIREKRTNYVDFTLPYTESGVYMIVPIKEMVHKNSWIFLKPLTTDLWFATFAFFLYTGFVVWVIEHRTNPEFRGPGSHQFGTILHFSFSTMVYAHREHVKSILSKLVLIIWFLVVLILTSSYTASLASMLTVQQLQPTVTNLDQLLTNGDYVGSINGSFMVDRLKELKFDEKKIKLYNSIDNFSEAIFKGSQNGGISAIIDELPYIRLILKQHCANLTMIGPILKNEGLAYAFPKDSPLVHDISNGLLKVVEGEKIKEIEKKWFGDQITCQNQGNTITPNNLQLHNFGGLFLITGIVSTCALSSFLIIFLRKNWHELRSIGADKQIWMRFASWFNYYNKAELKSPSPLGSP